MSSENRLATSLALEPIRGVRNAPIEGEEYNRFVILVLEGGKGYRAAEADSE